MGPGLTGGTEAPKVGLGQASSPSRGRVQRPRHAQRVAAARRRRNGGTEAPSSPRPAAVAAARPVSGPRPQTGVGQNELPSQLPGGIGHQLTRLVGSGAVAQPQAEETAKERQLLQWAYGKNWRKVLGGGRGNVRLAREALAKEPENPLVKANYEALMARRAKLLQHARELRGVTTTPVAE